MITAILIVSVINLGVNVYLLLRRPHLKTTFSPPVSHGIMTPNGVIIRSEKKSPIYNDDERLWRRERGDESF